MDSDVEPGVGNGNTGATPTEPTPPTQPPPAVQPTALYVKFDLGVWQAHDVQNKLEMAFNNTGMEYVAPPSGQ